jgi:ankyrin repeat protein
MRRMMEPSWTPYHHDIANGRLITKLPDIDIDTPDAYGVTPLNLACLSGSVEQVKRLIDLGANVNSIAGKYKSTPLLTAARDGCLGIVEALLESGKVENLDYTDALGNTALHYATSKEMYDMLLRHGADESMLDLCPECRRDD